MSDEIDWEEEENYGAIIEDVYAEFEHLCFRTRKQVLKAVEEYAEALRDKGVPEDIVEKQKESFEETTWTHKDYAEYYGEDIDEYDDEEDDEEDYY